MMDHIALFSGRWRIFGRIGMFLFFCMVSSMAYGAGVLVNCNVWNGATSSQNFNTLQAAQIATDAGNLTKGVTDFGAPWVNDWSTTPNQYPFFSRWSKTYWAISGGYVFVNITCMYVAPIPPPIVSLKLGKPSVAACEAETGTITVTSNDPTPNGGTVTLTLSNGNPVSASFTGKTATLTFADFGLLNGYTGTHKPGNVLSFTADVTTAAGYTALSTATANVVAGGLNVTITPAKTVVEPTLPIRRKKGQNGANQTSVTIKVTNKASQPIDGANISLTVERASTKFGGHDHDAATIAASTRPLGSVTSAIGQGQGVYTSTYTASAFAAEDKIRANVTFQGCSANVVSSPITSTVFDLGCKLPHRMWRLVARLLIMDQITRATLQHQITTTG